ncbi:MAG: hypothetical protein K0S74_1219 [Chlamydiales bacterium]|jgi:hypothetical protein|nr:hypothetical protein [Chlamydiales bacterium]
MKIRQFFVFTALVASTLGLNSCFNSNIMGSKKAITPGVAVYSGGELQVIEDSSLDLAWDAALKAMKDLEIKVISAQKDKLVGTIMARRADDSKVVIKLKKDIKGVTYISIKAGNLLGDESAAENIYAQIRANLGRSA